MPKDKSAEERYQLSRKINDLDMREEDFAYIRRHYEKSLEDFYARFASLSHRQEALLSENTLGQHQQVRLAWEANQQLTHRLNQYVTNCYEELDSVGRCFRRKIDDKRDRLIEERNRLPWD